MAQRNVTLSIANRLMKLILRSRWHTIASNQVMLVSVTGRKTGNVYTTPVNYVFDEETATLTVISHKHRTWWRNLRGGAPVVIWLRGSRLEITAKVFEEEDRVAELMYEHLLEMPEHAAPLGVRLDEDDEPIEDDMAEAAVGKVIVVFYLIE